MIYIALSVLCSVTVSVLLKLAPRWQVDLRQAIGGGYLVASLLCMLFLNASFNAATYRSADSLFLLLALGILLPSIFLVLAISVQKTGIVRTDAAMRLSLILPLIAAFTLFGERLSPHKLLGIVLGLGAIACIVIRRESEDRSPSGAWQWPLLVFFGMGVIDMLFKRMSQAASVPFADTLLSTFSLAFVLSVLYLAACYRNGRAHWRWRHAGGAVLIGCFNFGNILFYILAHRRLASDPALVFTSMNIGVIIVATAIGVWWFRERLSRLNVAGLLVATCAVLVLASA
ncbi:MAG: EamA/RhaT family transporter [Comamonas sp.]|jgi:hypothetical protein